MWQPCFDIHRVPSLFTFEINRWKVKGNKWGERWEKGEKAQAAICHAERHSYRFWGKKKKRDISLWEQLFGSRQAVVTGTYIRPDLVCFGCFFEMLQLWETGGWWLSRVSLSLFSPVVVPSCAFAYFFFFHLPVSLSSWQPYSALISSVAGVDLYDL